MHALREQGSAGDAVPHVHLKDMLGHARAQGCAASASDAVDSNFRAAILAGAQRARRRPARPSRSSMKTN